MDDIMKIDLYLLLGIEPSATVQDVKKAYRKKALACHPDKNPDNPKAAESFHQLSKALEILCDDSARAAYDKVLNAKKAASLRNRALDSRRKKLKEALEASERKAQSDVLREQSAEVKLKAEIERLRKEGSKQLEEEIKIVQDQIQREKLSRSKPIDPVHCILKVSWKNLNNETSNVYTHENLRKIFSKYGEIAALVVSNKTKSAILEFYSSLAAVEAQRLEKGFTSCPLSVSWLSGTPPSNPGEDRDGDYITAHHIFPLTSQAPTYSPKPTGRPAPTPTLFPGYINPPPNVFTEKRQDKQDIDLESVVLSRMKQAEEQKRKAAETIETELE